MKPSILLASCVLFTVFIIGHFNVAYANTSAKALVEKVEPAVTFKPLPQTTELERAEYFPTAEQINVMRIHLQSSKIISGEGTHTPIQTLQVGIPHKPGVVVYFARLPDADYVWILEEWISREKGFHIVFWWFLENRIKYHTVDIPSGQGPATEYVNSEHPLWSEALQKSKMVWRLLCGKYSCSADELSP
ncbi:MAG: hypothetical protein Q8R36_05205 [bacterium]|nr:hypothetical protein [bacterium]